MVKNVNRAVAWRVERTTMKLDQEAGSSANLAMNTKRSASLFLWSALILLSLASGIVGLSLIEPDEGRTAEISREIHDSGSLFLPKYNDLPYLDKPFMYFAASAVSMSIVGITESAARIPALLSALALALATAWFAHHLFGRRGAYIAGIATATSPLFMAFSRIAIFDSMLSLFVVLSLIFFYRAIEAQTQAQAEPGAERQPSGWLQVNGWSLLAWIAIALGILTKGPIALALPLLVVTPFAIWRRASKAVWNPWGPLAMLALILPWLITVSLQVPGFLHYALVVETWQRVTTDKMNRTGPPWYFLPYLLSGAFPWSIAVAAGWFHSRRAIRSDPATRVKVVFLALWLALPLLLFSLSQSKRPQYILPLIPCFAILIAGLWSHEAETAAEETAAEETTAGETTGRRRRSVLPGRAAAAAALVVMGVVLLVAGLAFDPFELGAKPWVAALARQTAVALGLAALAGGILGWRAKSWATALIALSLPAVAMPVVTRPMLQAISNHRSSKELAASIKPHLKTGTQVVLLDSFPHSLLFYLQETVLFASTDATALRSGFVAENFAAHLQKANSPLRTREWWFKEAASCGRDKIFVIRQTHATEIALLEAAGHMQLGNDERFLFFGPCSQHDDP